MLGSVARGPDYDPLQLVEIGANCSAVTKFDQLASLIVLTASRFPAVKAAV